MRLVVLLLLLTFTVGTSPAGAAERDNYEAGVIDKWESQVDPVNCFVFRDCKSKRYDISDDVEWFMVNYHYLASKTDVFTSFDTYVIETFSLPGAMTVKDRAGKSGLNENTFYDRLNYVRIVMAYVRNEMELFEAGYKKLSDQRKRRISKVFSYHPY